MKALTPVSNGITFQNIIIEEVREQLHLNESRISLCILSLAVRTVISDSEFFPDIGNYLMEIRCKSFQCKIVYTNLLGTNALVYPRPLNMKL